MPTYAELLAQREELDQEIAETRKIEVGEACRQIKALIQEFDLTAKQCGFAAGASNTTKAGKKVKPKYITPDGKITWSGRGKLPNVFKALLAEGRRMEDFLI
mgnify:FL=1